jgi:hypothetical protein
MTYSEAQKICGNQSKYWLRNMVLALSMHPWLNTKAENERLMAAKIILRGE